MNHFTEQLTEHVEAGCTQLDHDLPGWAEMIDTPVLDMQSCQRCVVGQIKHWCTRNMRGASCPEYIRHPDYQEALGFDLPVSLYSDGRRTVAEVKAAWDALAALWIDAIRERTS